MIRGRRRPSVRASMRRSAGLVLLLLAASAGPVLAQGGTADVSLPPGISTHERVVRYPVTGDTPTELRQSMLTSGPEEDGGIWYGYTTWHVEWRYDYAPFGGACRIEDVDVTFRSTVQLPRWQPPTVADDDLVSRWRDFVSALREHEFGHRDIGARAARDILDRLRDFRAGTCHRMTDRANDEAHDILDRYRLREDRYDRSTNHGGTQGAVWPPAG